LRRGVRSYILAGMQTTWERMKDYLATFMLMHGARVKHALKCAATVLMVAFLMETFVFNSNYWMTRDYDCINLSDKLTLQKNVDKTYKLTEINHVIEFSNLNKEVKNIRIDFDGSQAAQNVDVKIEFTDAAHETYFDSTEYSAGVPVRTVSTNDDATEYLKLNTTGITNNLRIEITGDDITYPIKIKAVYINNVYPFSFSTTRFWLAVAVLSLLYVFRPRSSIYRMSIVEHPRFSKTCVVLSVLLEVYLVSIFLFMGSNLVGVATANYNSGSWDRKSLVNTFKVGGDNAQQYADLAKAMADGKLYLEQDPPDWLVHMDNPYDKGARDELQKSTGDKYLWDVAYYQGHYYVYFGVVPVVAFYLPFYLITGLNFPTAIGVWIACIAFILGCTALLDRFARYHFKRVSLGLYLLLQMPLIFCSGILYLVKFPSFYSLPIMMALALSVWGLYLWMRGRTSENPGGWFLGGSLCMALVLGCRPQLLVLSLVAIPLFWRVYITERRLFTKQGAREFACLIAPYLLVGAGVLWYNYARFGKLTDFGSSYNLTTNDMTKRGWDIGRLAPALFAFFFQSPSTTGVFPYLQACTFDTTYMGQTIKEATFGGVFACLPILWLLPLTGRGIKMRMKARSTRTIAGVLVVLLGSGVLVALADAELAGILQRYYADFSFMFLMVVVLVAFIMNENMDHRSSVYEVAMRILPALVCLSLIYSFLLCLVAETGWYSDAYPWAYQSILHLFQFWT
jgi:hypothetical protein